MAPPRWPPRALLLSLFILITSVLAFEVPILDTGSSEMHCSPSKIDREIRLFPTNMQWNVGWAFSLYQRYFVLSRNLE